MMTETQSARRKRLRNRAQWQWEGYEQRKRKEREKHGYVGARTALSSMSGARRGRGAHVQPGTVYIHVNGGIN